MNKIDHTNIVAHLDHILTEFTQKEAIPGLAVGIVQDSRILYTKGFGVKSILSQEPVDERTLFHQASISKTLVATAIMQLVERGMIQLDCSICDYLPYFSMADDRFRFITIRQLLNHTSGMPDEDDYGWDRPEYDELALERYVRGLHQRKLSNAPGEQYEYSNIAFEILGDVIAKISGKSFEQHMKDHIFTPVQMTDSTFLKHEANDRLATPHILKGNRDYGATISDVFPYHRAHGPSSTLYANAVDMCRYAIAQLNKGVTAEGETIVQAQSFDELWKPNALTGEGAASSHVGLSWFLGQYKGHMIVSHSGMDTGFQSILKILPEQGIAVSVMINSDYVWPASVCNSLLDLLLGDHVPYIQRSLAHHLATMTINHSIELAWDEYQRIQMSNELELYYNWKSEFDFIASVLTDNGYQQEAMKLLELTAQLHHRSL